MKPVIINKEIEAFVGDRLLEAVWREGLWLIKDDICDTSKRLTTLSAIPSACAGRRWACSKLSHRWR
jgi:carnitine 3-dehydrogenase